MLLTALTLLAAQGTAAIAPAAAQERLKSCLQQAQAEPAKAIPPASRWLAESKGAAKAWPQQCLGQAYASLQKWNAAHDAFLAARDAAMPSDYVTRAHLGAMAGNAALAGKDPTTALPELEKALADAGLTGDKPLAGSIEGDKARALVALGRNEDAAKALDLARSEAPRDAQVWLLSATLARRMGQLAQARQQIETAETLDRTDPAIGLEAGVIAELGGDEAAARKSWQSVIATTPDGPEAISAKAYLAQIGGSGG
jgi:tetratricopeptide (TPR) repeat protein